MENKQGIMVSPWIVTLIVSLSINVVGFAYTWGTVVTRLDALSAQVERLQRLSDQDRDRERTRGPANYSPVPMPGERH